MKIEELKKLKLSKYYYFVGNDLECGNPTDIKLHADGSMHYLKFGDAVPRIGICFDTSREAREYTHLKLEERIKYLEGN